MSAIIGDQELPDTGKSPPEPRPAGVKRLVRQTLDKRCPRRHCDHEPREAQTAEAIVFEVRRLLM